MKRCASSPPTLSINKLPPRRIHHASPQGMLTPPLHAMATIPFQWEEAPGKPRKNTNESSRRRSPSSKPKSVRSLKLVSPSSEPEAQDCSNHESPTSIMDGPEQSWSPKNGLESESGPDDDSNEIGQLGPYRCKSTGSFVVGRKENGPPMVDSDGDVKVKIMRFRRKSKGRRGGSFHNLSRTSSQIMGSFKRLLQWSSGQEKLRATTANKC